MPTLTRAAAACAAAVLAIAAASASAAGATSRTYVVTNVVSNGAVPTPYTDPHMINTWGVSFNPTGLVWVTNERTGTSTLYDGNGVPNSLIVTVPPASTTSGGTGSPTGIVFSGTSDFQVTNGTVSGPSRFIFASEDGLISGWAPNVDHDNAIRVVVTPNAAYTGLATAASSTGARLYAADFRNGRVDMFDSQFRKVTATGAFVDPALVGKGLVPFGIQAIGSNVYVSFIKQDGSVGINLGKATAPQQQQSGSSGGGSVPDAVVDVFTADGKYVRRAASGNSALKQPWGIAVAPADFGLYASRLLIADFHDGRIGAYDQNNGNFLGFLPDAKGGDLKVPGIWGIQFGNGINAQPTNALFFAAGPNGQGAGVYGSIAASPPN